MIIANLRLAWASTAAISVIALLMGFPAHATMDDEAQLAETAIRQAILQLDEPSQKDRKTVILRGAVEAMAVLEKLASPTIDNDTAEKAASALGMEAITSDMLRLSLVEALSIGIGSDAAGLKQDLEAKAVIADIVDPAYRSAAWSQLARMHVRINQMDEAERLGLRAIEDARGIDRRQTRDGAMRAVATIFPFDGKHGDIIEAATDAMTSSGARSEIYRLEALALFVRERKLSADALINMADEARKSGDLSLALQAVRSLERDNDRRKELLAGLFDQAVEKQDNHLALQVLKSMVRASDQDKALRKLVDIRLASEKPIRAREYIALMLTNGQKVDAEIAVARALDKQGYHQAALDTLTALNVSPVEDPDSAADLASAFAGLSAFDRARPLAEAIKDPKERSFAFSRLSKRLADADRITEARALLGEISHPEDLSHARSGLARALIKSGKLEEAENILKDIPEGPDRDRVVEELAKRHAREGNLDGARSHMERVKTAATRGRVLIEIGASFGTDKRDDAVAVLDEARAILTSTHDKERDVADQDLADLAIAYLRLGETDTAGTLTGMVSSRAIRDITEQTMSGILIEKDELDAARTRLDRLAPETGHAVAARLASAQYERDGDVEALVKAVHGLPYSLRIQALREMSESRARNLDRHGWLNKVATYTLPAIPDMDPEIAQKANFNFGRHVVQAPVPSTRSANELQVPDIFSLTADKMRSRIPAPVEGVAHLAILGFSPFSLEAFKLTSGGNAAIHQVQLSQQMTWPRYIAIEKGVVTLGSLLRDIPQVTSKALLVDRGAEILIRVPIIVLPGATLLLSGAEFSRYQLGAQSGAFIAVAGKLIVQDTEVIGYDEQTNAPALGNETNKSVFRPFITGWGGSDLELAGSRFAMLGYDSSKAFGLTQSSGAAVQSLYATHENRPRGNIVENSFENLRYGYYSYETSDVKLIANEYRDNVVYGIDPHDRSRNLLIALNTAYDSQKKHGIIVSREVDDSFIIGNVAIWNKGSGLMLDRTSSRNIVYANTAIANHGDGLTFYESGCNIAAANEFSRNLRAGIKVRNSIDVGLYDNHLSENKTSGADVYVADLRTTAEGRTRDFELDPYQPISTTVISGNSFARNGNAINVDGASQTILEANRFRDQRSNIYGGELRPLSPYLLQLGESSATLIGMACQPKVQPAINSHSCHFAGLQFPQPTETSCTGISQPLGTGTGSEGNNG